MSIRRGADGRGYRGVSGGTGDEAKANPFPVPLDALLLKDGKRGDERETVVDEADGWRLSKTSIRVAGARRTGGSGGWGVLTQETIGDVPVVTKKLIGTSTTRLDRHHSEYSTDVDDSGDREGLVLVMMELACASGARFTPLSSAAGADVAAASAGEGLGYAELSGVGAADNAGLTRRDDRPGTAAASRKPTTGALRAGVGASWALDDGDDKAVDAKQWGSKALRFWQGAGTPRRGDQSLRDCAAWSSSGEAGRSYGAGTGASRKAISRGPTYHWMDGNFLKH